MLRIILWITTFSGLFFALNSKLIAQYETVTFDIEKQHFNSGQKLPSETYMMISGGIPSDYGQVELLVYRNRKRRKPLYSNSWQRFSGDTKGMFEIPCNYKLRSHRYYDFVFRYHRRMNETEKEELKEEIFKIIDTHLEQTFRPKNNRIKFLQSARRSYKKLNKQVIEVLEPYHADNNQFEGFSPLLLQSMRNFKKGKLTDKNISTADSLSNLKKGEQKTVTRKQNYQERLEGLKEVAYKDIERLFKTPLLVKAETRDVSRYPTQSTMNVVAINAGYGAVMLSEASAETVEYDAAPYVGLSVPLGNRSFSGAFWSNSSLSLGAFVSNFENSSGEILTGPVVGRPYYLGFGYRAFQFVRLNAGGIALENTTTKQMQIRPFAGISVEINLWMGIGNRKN
ncbi:MAG: hypothetical protein JJT94_09625 [Bernardetiaceae bacterium]|nr:hypothetical protein [Bernardetiaceae bacterium]